MAHLTNYTYSKLCRKLDINQEIDLDLFLKEVYNNPKIYIIFNKLEINYLFVYKQLLDDPEKFQKIYRRFADFCFRAEPLLLLADRSPQARSRAGDGQADLSRGYDCHSGGTEARRGRSMHKGRVHLGSQQHREG